MSRGTTSGLAPILMGAALIGVGLAARRMPQPHALDLPGPGGKAPRLRDVRGVGDAAHVARDGVAGFIPGNLFSSLGRTLLLMGGAVLAVRALDELVDDDGADY